MMQHRELILLFVSSLFLYSCGQSNVSDAYGNFEATSVTISAKGNGELLEFNVEEGSVVEKGERIGLIDTTQLHLEKQLLQAQLDALIQKTKEAEPDKRVLEERKANIVRERNRTEELQKDEAATQKQMDDLNGEIELIDQQIRSLEQSIRITNRGILAESEPVKAQLRIVEHRINDHIISNPIHGTVLTKLVEPFEYVNTSKPLYKIADLSTMKLRAYTTAQLLQNISLNDEVTVLIDNGESDYRQLDGTLIWIASEAEFTPENIQTKQERVDLVYAIDVLVENDGSLRIGMPGEVVFTSQREK